MPLGLSFKILLSFTFLVRQLLYSSLNWILTPSYMSNSCLGLIRLNWAKTALINIRVKFQNVFKAYSWTYANFAFWSDLNSSSFILFRVDGWVAGLFEIKTSSAPNLGWGLGWAWQYSHKLIFAWSFLIDRILEQK